MVHNHYLEEAKKKTQESNRKSEPSVIPSASSQSTANGSKPKPRINNQKSRNWPASKSSCVTTKTVPIAEHSRNSRSFSDSKHFVCSTCQKCVFNANHDSCVTKFLNEVNSRAKVPSNKTTKRYIPVEQTSFAKKPERQIPKRHRQLVLGGFQLERYSLPAQPRFDSESQNGSKCRYLLNHMKDAQKLFDAVQNSEFTSTTHEQSSSKLVPKVVPPADKTATSRQVLELLFHHHITMLRSTYIKMEMVSHHSIWSRIHYTSSSQSTNDIPKAQGFKNHESSRIKDKDFRANSDIKDNSSEIKLRGRLLVSFQDDVKYEYVG
ncbi:hypothetical protein Tco_0712630 [Tanacetum coccineum]